MSLVLLTEAVLTETDQEKLQHIDHLEDLPVLEGQKGLNDAIELLRDLAEGSGTAVENISVKFDGAPSIVVGRNPDNGQFFVSTKSAWAKTPKLAYTARDVEQMFGHSQGLGTKMAEALAYLKPLGFDRILQGDFLFGSGDKEIKNIDGIDYVLFKPQLLTYGVPLSTKLGQFINQAKLGFVWHTEYTGDSFATLVQKQGADISMLKSTNNVWNTTNLSNDLTQITNPVSDKTKKIINGLANFNISSLERLISDREVQAYLYGYTNYLVDQGKILMNGSIKDFKEFIKLKETNIARKKIEKAKTEKGRAGAKQTALEKIERYWQHIDLNAQGFKDAQKLNQILTTIKMQIYKKVHEFGGVRAFLDKTKEGGGIDLFSHEGLSVYTKQGRLVKFIDRDEFSKINRAMGGRF